MHLIAASDDDHQGRLQVPSPAPAVGTEPVVRMLADLLRVAIVLLLAMVARHYYLPQEPVHDTNPAADSAGPPAHDTRAPDLMDLSTVSF